MKKNFYYIVNILIIIVIFSLHGANIWGEIILEYIPHAFGNNLSNNSFAGYLTIFPILITKIYYFIFNGKILSWPAFANIIACTIALLSTSIIIKVAKDKKIKNLTLFIMLLPIYILLVHPSVSNFINITHIGYLPIMFYILIHIFDDDFYEQIKNIPWLIFIPLIISLLSKPTLTFIPIFLILIFTRLYKSPAKFLCLFGSCLFSTYQSLLYKQAASNFVLNSFNGFVKFILSLFQSLGGTLIFNFNFYKVLWTQNQYIFYSIISISLGAIIFSLIVLSLKKNREMKDFIKRFIIIGSIGFISLFPFAALNFELSLKEVINLNITSVFSKYKLQYQLTACFIIMAIVIILINKLFSKKENNKVLKFLNMIIVILCVNGLLTSIYASHWPNVNSIKGINYNYSDIYLYAPYAEWDLNWNSEANGWAWKDPAKIVKKYLATKIENNTYFDKFNLDIDKKVLKNIKNGKIYLNVIDKNINIQGETNYINGLLIENTKEKGTLIIDNKEYAIDFSIASYNKIRYAVIDYDYKIFMGIYSDNFKLKINNKSINNKYVNEILIYE